MPDKPGEDLFGCEINPEVLREGERQFHAILYMIQQYVDPAFTFILGRFNRRGITHQDIDAVCYMDHDGIPTLGINFAKFLTYSQIAQISVIEHAIGHFMSGHLGNCLGLELRQYCEMRYGETIGKQLYYLVTECVADCFVSYPNELRKHDRPVYDMRQLGLKKWTATINVLRHIEDLLEQAHAAGFSTEEAVVVLTEAMAQEMPKDKRMEAEQEQMQWSKNWKKSDKKFDSNKPLDIETGGMPIKDLVMHLDKASTLIGENNTRDIIRTALERCPSTKDRGFLAGDAAEFIEAEESQPVVPWFQQVNQTITRVLSNEQRITKKRFNRRMPDIGFGRIHENTTSIVLVVDTSGSMGPDELCYVDAQARFLAQQVDELYVIHADAGVAKCELYHFGMTLTEFFGRGGTDFEPALHYIRDELGIPDAVVFITDGYGGKLNDEDPIIGDWETQLVWVLTPNGLDEDRFKECITNLGQIIKVESWD